MEAELQTLAARLAAHRWLPRRDALVKRALTDELFRNGLNERLAACGMELVEHPYADNVALRIRRDMEQPVFGGADIWLSNNLDLKRDQVALLVVLWALLVLPKRQKQIERRNARSVDRQSEMFGIEKPVPSAAEIGINVAEATLVADYGDRLGGKTRIGIALSVLSRNGFIERRDGRIYEGALLDLVLDYTRMARRVIDGTLSDLFNTHIEDYVDEEAAPAPDIEAPLPDDVDAAAIDAELMADDEAVPSPPAPLPQAGEGSAGETPLPPAGEGSAGESPLPLAGEGGASAPGEGLPAEPQQRSAVMNHEGDDPHVQLQ